MDAIVINRPQHLQILFNISTNVGPGQRNDAADVQLVQLGYYCMAKNPLAKNTPEEQAAYSAVNVGAPYGGDPNDPLSRAIVVHEKIHGGTQDKHVSRMQGITYAPGVGSSGRYLLLSLNNNIADRLKDVWPRIDLSNDCPPSLKFVVKKLLTRV